MYIPFYLSSLCFLPFNGILVRYRLAYHPTEAFDINDREPTKPLQIATEAEAAVTKKNMVITHNDTTKKASENVYDVPTGSTRPTFVQLARKVYQKESYVGLYKGFLPTSVVNLIVPLFSHGGMPRLYISPAPTTVDQSLQQALFGAIFYTLAVIWVYRAIATRAKLEIFGTNIKDGVKILFTHHEREKLWRLYSPSLLSVFVTNIFLRILVLRPLSRLVVSYGWRLGDETSYYMQIAANVLLILASTAFLAPLDVITTRLAVQRNHGGAKTTSDSPVVSPIEGAAMDIESAHSTEQTSDQLVESVAVRFRADSDLEPYKNAYDCVRQIVEEEGWGVLYRGWFFTFLGIILSGQTY